MMLNMNERTHVNKMTKTEQIIIKMTKTEQSEKQGVPD